MGAIVYKRKVNVVFLEAGDGSRAQRAEFWARELGEEWLEPAAGVVSSGGVEWLASGPGQAPDLRVVLETVSGATQMAETSYARIKRWPLGTDCWQVDDEVCDQRIRQRVTGLLGGLQMKAREDAVGDSGTD